MVFSGTHDSMNISPYHNLHKSRCRNGNRLFPAHVCSAICVCFPSNCNAYNLDSNSCMFLSSKCKHIHSLHNGSMMACLSWLCSIFSAFSVFLCIPCHLLLLVHWFLCSHNMCHSSMLCSCQLCLVLHCLECWIWCLFVLHRPLLCTLSIILALSVCL